MTQESSGQILSSFSNYENNNLGLAGLGFSKTYDLTDDNIDKIAPIGLAGNYIYSEPKKAGLNPYYIGRSDTDINDRSKHGIDEYGKVSLLSSKNSKESFELECLLFHRFGKDKLLSNKIHPAKPKDTNYKCPYC